jgi:uncharacterized protein
LLILAIALLALYLALPASPVPLAWPDAAWLAAHVEQANQVYRAGSWVQVTRFSLGWGFGAAGAALTFADAYFADAYGQFAAAGWIRLLSNITPVCLALAFAAMVLYMVEFTRTGTRLRAFTAIGRMAFTNYIAQSVVFGLVFFGYGLGQFGSLRPAPVFAIGVAVYAMQVQLSRLWLRHYRFGPIEWLWRTLMYGRRQPMSRDSAGPA